MLEDTFLVSVSDIASGTIDSESTASAATTGMTEMVLPYTMPQSEYMYGCAATAIGMLLGYYDLYGYAGYSVSNIISGTISVYSRGTDGNIYDMDAFNTTLGAFIASTDYVEHFYGTTSTEELAYTFVNGDASQGLNVSQWDCLADWLGTGQYWRGNSDLSTSNYYCTLGDLYQSNYTYTVDNTTLSWRYADFKWGLNEYLKSRGYSLDQSATKTVKTDTVSGGTFTFADFKAEIDAGRSVLISMVSGSNSGHMVVAYGYDSASGEIIFDDTYRADCRMSWTGGYSYSNESYTIRAVSTVVFNTTGLTELPDTSYIPGEWATDKDAAFAYAKAHNLPILVYYESPTCGYCRALEANVFDSDDFRQYVNSGSVVLLKNVYGLGISESGTPAYGILSADGTVLSSGSGYKEKSVWMDWFDNYVSLIDTSARKIDLGFTTPSG